MLIKVPDLEARLWQTPADSSMGELIEIESDTKSYGRRILSAEWAKQLSELERNLATQDRSMKKSEEEIARQIQKAIDGLHGSEAYLAAKKQNKRAMEAELMKSLRSNSDVKAWARSIAIRILQNPNLRVNLGSSNPDEVLSSWDHALQSPEHILGIEKESVPAVVFSEVREILPSISTLVGNESIFPREMLVTNQGARVPVPSVGKAKYVFRVLPRRFHGIFKGIILGECTGGACGNLKSLHPERWATGALRDAQITYIERNGRHLGFTEIVPGHIGWEQYGSVSFGAPALTNPISKFNKYGELETLPLFSRWIEKVYQRLPKTWRGLVLSERWPHPINAAGVIASVQGSPHFLFGKPIKMEPFGFSFDQDSMAKEVIDNSPPRVGDAEKYGGNWMTDASVYPKSRNTVRVLRPEGCFSEKDFEIINGVFEGKLLDDLLAERNPNFVKLPISYNGLNPNFVLNQIRKEDRVKAFMALGAAAGHIHVRVEAKKRILNLIEKGSVDDLNQLAIYTFSQSSILQNRDLLERLIEKEPERCLTAMMNFVFSKPYAVELKVPLIKLISKIQFHPPGEVFVGTAKLTEKHVLGKPEWQLPQFSAIRESLEIQDQQQRQKFLEEHYPEAFESPRALVIQVHNPSAKCLSNSLVDQLKR
jgi:hypothetical protein